MDQEPIRTKSGTVRIADMNDFPASSNMSAALVEVAPGGLRELHWQPMSDEWQLHQWQSQDDCLCRREPRQHGGFCPERCWLCAALYRPLYRERRDRNSPLPGGVQRGQYSDISLTTWMSNLPRELVAAHLNIDPDILKQLAQTKTPVVPA